MLTTARIWGVAFCLLSSEMAPALAANSANQLFAKHSSYLKGAGTNGPYRLPHSFAISGSLQIVSSEGLPLLSSDYKLNSADGTLYFSKPLQVGDSVQIIYTFLESNLQKRYYHRELPTTTDVTAPTSNPSPRIQAAQNKSASPAPAVSSGSLELSGNKSFSIEAGNAGDLKFQQGLDLTLKGRIAEDVRVLAILSDRGDFYSPQGTTQRLEELDKLRLEINSPNLGGSLGDLEIQNSSTRLASFDKKIKGVQSRAKFSNLSVTTAVANSRGTFHSNLIYGQEGKQGPYYLSDKGGRARIAILTGTEKVWLDGQQLQRGSDLDYTIDYLTGSLQFTPKRLITSQSVIRVDFEYSQEDYSRKFVATRAEMVFKQGALRLGGSFVSEGDVRGSPLGFSLTSVEEQVLKSAGDSYSQARENGATWVGENQGDYALEMDSSGYQYYRYAGEKQGDYQVRFSFVGEKQGDYVYQGAGVYTYVGQKQGSNAPVQNLPLPRSHNLLGMDLSFRPNQSWEIQMELARSNLDRNTFSGLDDNDNQGWGFDSRLNLSHSDFRWWGRKISQFKTTATLFVQDENFLPLNRIKEIEEERIWSLSSEIKSNKELKWQVAPELILGRNLSLAALLGQLRRGAEFYSQRQSWNLVLPSFNTGSVSMRSDRTDSRLLMPDSSFTSGWKNQAVGLQQPVKSWLLRGGFSGEQRREKLNGQKWNKIELGLSSNSNSLIAYQLDWFKTKSERLGTSWTGFSDSRTWRWRGSLREWKKSLSTSWEYTYNKIEYLGQNTGNRTQNLATWQIDFSPSENYLNLELRYQINQGGVFLKSHNYVLVPEGQGEYRLENGEYVPDPHGNYYLLIENSAEIQSSLLAEKSFHLTVEPSRLFGQKNVRDDLAKLLTWLHSDTYLRLDNQIPDRAKLEAGFLLPWGFLQSDSVYLKNYSWQQELRITPSFTKNYFQVRWQKESLENSKYFAAAQLNQSFRRSLTAYLNFGSSHLLQLDQVTSQREQSFTGYPSHLITGQEFSATYTRRLGSSSQYFLTGRYLWEEDGLQSVSSTLFSISPGLAYSPAPSSRWRGKVGWHKVASDALYLSWLLAEGKQKGNNFDWDFGLDLRVRQNFQYSASYRGNLLADKSPLHYFKFDLTATF